MKHFVCGEYDENNLYKEVNTDNFFKELEQLYRKYNISISHQDGHGAFILEEFDQFNLDWIKSAEVQPSLRDLLNSIKMFKIGDKVRIIDAMDSKYIGKIGIIEEVSSHSPLCCKLTIDGKSGSWASAWLFSCLELA